MCEGSLLEPLSVINPGKLWIFEAAARANAGPGAGELPDLGSRAIVAAMRAPGSWSLLLATSFTSSVALAQPTAPAAPTATPAVAPAPPPEPAPPPTPPPAAPEPAPVTPASDAAKVESSLEAAPKDTVATPPSGSSAQIRADATLPAAATAAPADVEPKTDFTRDFHALPLTLEARFGFNARLGSSFDEATQEERWGASYAFASYLAWRPEFALGLELDYSGLGRVRALSGQNSVDNQYGAMGAWIGARVFPIRSERLDFFVNLRVGMVWQHVDALGTHSDTGSITVPAQSFACSEWDGPGIGLGGAVGLAFRLGRHTALVSRLDLNGERLSDGSLGSCAAGIGSVASIGGSVGLAFEFETAPK